MNAENTHAKQWQGCDPDEPYDPLKCAIWAALVPFQNELLATGGVTFMGLRNSIVEAVRSFAIASQREALLPASAADTDADMGESGPLDNGGQ